MKLCNWCQEEPVKLAKNETCSRSCGSSLRWFRLKSSGKLLKFEKAEKAAKRTLYYARLQKEIEDNCKELEITLTSAVRRLYIRARNRGYHNGYYQREGRERKNNGVWRRGTR
jgi:hypothetical protein